jgi:hypothetical protein
MQTKINVAVILVCLFVMQLGRKDKNFQGLIQDAEKQPIAGATVTLQHDSIRRSAVSNGFGAFAFEEIAAGAYLLDYIRCRFYNATGYSESGKHRSAKENQYTLTRGNKLLQTVSVTANKNFIEQKIDRTGGKCGCPCFQCGGYCTGCAGKCSRRDCQVTEQSASKAKAAWSSYR